MAGKITTNSVVLGDSVTDTQNFVLKTNADGTATLARGALGGLGTVFGVNGSGALTGATLVAPALGTPASGVLTNCTGVVAAALPAGSVLQVVSTTLATTVSTTSVTPTYVDITGLSVSITPRSASSKILISASINRGISGNILTFFQFMRDSTAIGIGDTAGSRLRSTMAVYFGNADAVSHIGAQAMNYLDSPSTTSATTYKVQFCSSSAGTAYINRNSSDGDNNTAPRTISTITVMEIQG